MELKCQKIKFKMINTTKNNKNPFEIVLLVIDITLFLFILAFALINMAYYNMNPEYYRYNDQSIHEVIEPRLIPCDPGTYICQEKWLVGREPYIKVVNPTLYWVLNNEGKLVLFLLAYFISTQRKKILRICRKVRDYNEA